MWSLGREKNITVTCVKVTDTLEVKKSLADTKGNEHNGVKPREDDVLGFNIRNKLPNGDVFIRVCYWENEKLADQFQGHCKEGDSEKRLSRRNWQWGMCWWSTGPGPAAGPKDGSGFA